MMQTAIMMIVAIFLTFATLGYGTKSAEPGKEAAALIGLVSGLLALALAYMAGRGA